MRREAHAGAQDGEGFHLDEIGLDRLLDLGSRNIGVGPALRLPVFDAGRLRANLQGRAADADAAVAAYNAVVLDALREAADAGTSLRALVRQQQELAQALASAERLHGAAADAADKALAIFNTERAEAKLPLMRHGIALHIGDVQYGNIGANRRLDFTVIGPAVNKAARIESLCKETGRALLFSADFAAFVAGAQRVGEFKLKGIEEPETVFARD